MPLCFDESKAHMVCRAARKADLDAMQAEYRHRQMRLCVRTLPQ